MADILYWRDSIISEIEQIRAAISSAERKSNELDKSVAIDEADKKIRDTKAKIRTFKAEIRIIGDPEESNRYKKELSHFEQTVSQLTGDLQGLRSEGTRSSLFLGADTSGNRRPNGDDDPERAGDALLADAHRLQDKTQESLVNTTNMITESKTTGMMTLEELERQRETINNTEANVNRLEDNLLRADKLIKTFGKRMATDKLIQCFACVNILMIVGVIVYSIVKGGLESEPDAGSPESPVAQN
mmetsp:Transcript_22112/g.27124  ORF Transcript_22112/g.27124 Transcript_22112/m.27124 type:complete len:244 (+) Transcript_22112:145-876(+)